MLELKAFKKIFTLLINIIYNYNLFVSLFPSERFLEMISVDQKIQKLLFLGKKNFLFYAQYPYKRIDDGLHIYQRVKNILKTTAEKEAKQVGKVTTYKVNVFNNHLIVRC